MSSQLTVQHRYYPRLSSVITENDIPDILGFIKTGIVNLLDRIYFKDLQYSKSPKGDSAFYSLSVVSGRLDIEIPGTGIFLVLNPDQSVENVDNYISSFPITIEYQWKILAYLRYFSLGNFSFDPEQIFEVALRILNISEEQAIAHFVNTFVEPENQNISPLQQFVKDINAANDWNINLPTEATTLPEVVENIFEKSAGKYASLVAFGSYLATSDLQETSAKVKVYFQSMIPQDIDEFIKEVILPKFRATLLLSAAIEFPRNILKPVYREGTKDPNDDTKYLSLEVIPEPEKVTLEFAEALFYADTEKGFGYNLDLVLNTNYPAQIGNTGLIIDIHNLKIDISKTENIAEADADGRPKDFMGVYMEYTEIFLPKKWFKKQDGQTIGISANHLLVGTGGVSGNIAVRATYPTKIETGKTKVINYFQDYFNLSYPVKVAGSNNPISNHTQLVDYMNDVLESPSQLKFQFPLSLKLKGSNEEITFTTESGYYEFLKNLPPLFTEGVFESWFLWFALGDQSKPENKKVWSIGFQKFDIDFYHGKVVHSSLHAALKIPKFKRIKDNGELSDETLYVDIYGEWESSENFKLSANFLPDGLSMKLFRNIILTLQSAELGKSGNEFFIRADTKISFPEESVVSKLFQGKEIDLPAIRIYSNGRFEIAGGVSFIPVNFTLPLGPVEMSVTGLHLGSVQKEYKGKIRNYNYIGFDGALSVDPIGVDIKGNGIKYYYTTDDDDHRDADGEPTGHNYLHISTLEIDLIIPGTATEEQAMAVIRGSLTIPDPGVSEEYAGSVMIKLPKAKISGEAAMRLNPKNKSFLVKAAVEFPSPVIPLGPVGIYGFAGLIGKKYVADKKVVFPNDADSKSWYDYYMAPEQGIGVDKFRDPSQTGEYDNPFSIGVGASLATMADGGRTFSMRAMMLLSLPATFAIDAGLSILSERLQLTDKRVPPFYAFIIIGDDSLEFGAGANYQINKSSGWFIDIQAEIQAGFFFKNQRPWYINFGTKEKPITATLFKGILNIKAQSFLMISAAGIEAGAKVGFDFDLIIARAWVMVEVGAHISFERPQVGGYIYIEGGLSIKILIVQVSVAVSVFFSVELVKPFLIFAQLRIQFELRIKLWIVKIKIRFNVLLTFKWEKNKQVDNTPIAPLTFQSISDPDYPKIVRTNDSVKGIHMLTGEPFDLMFVKTEVKNNGAAAVYPAVNTVMETDCIIPLDTFIDIKVEKGLAPSALVDTIIGSHTGAANNHIELIPPNEVVKGGRTLRQVKHKYSIEEIEVKMAVGNSWVDYHPFEALFTRRRGDIDISSLRIGHWQRNSDQYDTIRLMATSPFSFMDAGEPGWFVPDQYGITPSSLFCTYQEEQWHISNFLNVPLGTEYIPPTGFIAYLICGAYYNIEGTYAQSYEIDEEGNVSEVSSGGKMVVRSVPNTLNYDKSLTFENSDNLMITLPEASAEVKLNLTTYAKGVTIKVYGKIISNNINPEYIPIGQMYLTKEQLINPVVLNLGNMGDPLSLIKVIPDTNDKDRINEIHQEIAVIWAEAEASAGDGSTSVILNSQQQAQLSILQNELALLRSQSCTGVSCKNLNFKEIFNRSFVSLPLSKISIINDQESLLNLNLSEILPEIDFSSSSVLAIPRINNYSVKVVKVIKTSDNIDIQLKDTIASSESSKSSLDFSSIIIQTEKIASDLTVTMTFDEINCCDSGLREDILCDYFDRLKTSITNCIDYNRSFVENIDCFDQMYRSIDDFDNQYPHYVIGDKYDFPTEWEYDEQNPPTVAEALEEAYGIIEMIKRNEGNCGCVGSDGGETESICTTSIQEVSWKTINEYEYEQTIPDQEAVSENSQATMDAMSKTIQPVWRPNTTYMLRFRLKDEVLFNGNTISSVFDYYYGFKTMGPVGHFHKQNPNYLGNNKEEEKTLTSLRSYLDYKRSYPNPDGNLMGSKPLFYGNEQCKIDLFFDKPYTYHMFSNWKEYNGLNEIEMDMPIVIKDPVSEAIIPYPLPEEWNEEDVPGVESVWINEEIQEFPAVDPRLPISIQNYLRYLKELMDNPGLVKCKLNIGTITSPSVKMRIVTFTNLKPEKLYTAIVYSAYDANEDGEINNREDQDGLITYEEIQKVHEFAFRTSRYENFREQVMSYKLTEADDNNNTIQTGQAVYELRLNLNASQINNLYALVVRKSNVETESLRNNYIHEFDRALEGILNIKPLDPPTHTDFVKIMDDTTGNVIAILVRNPEPFNDPRIPLEDMNDVLKVPGTKGDSVKYKILWSKDYSQAIVMHETKKITAKDLQFQFLYKTWNGSQRKYIVKDETDLNEEEKLNTVITEPIIINK